MAIDYPRTSTRTGPVVPVPVVVVVVEIIAAAMRTIRLATGRSENPAMDKIDDMTRP